MTDEEIKKALECCHRSADSIICSSDCPLYDECESEETQEDICGLAVDLIKRQQAEIERLETELKAMRGAANTYKKHYETAKSEAIKEFSERLKRRYESVDGQYIDRVLNTDINDIAKELTEGGVKNEI